MVTCMFDNIQLSIAALIIIVYSLRIYLIICNLSLPSVLYNNYFNDICSRVIVCVISYNVFYTSPQCYLNNIYYNYCYIIVASLP